MARQRRQRDYKAEYQRRKAQGRAAGKTTAQARGHGGARPEHIVRAERERARLGGFTRYELSKIEQFANRQGRTAQRRAEALAEFTQVAQTHGYGAINEIKSRLAAIERQRKADMKNIPKSDVAGRAAAKMDRIAMMYDLADEYDLDIEFLGY